MQDGRRGNGSTHGEDARRGAWEIMSAMNALVMMHRMRLVMMMSSESRSMVSGGVLEHRVQMMMMRGS